MKIEVNINKRFALVLLGFAFILAGVFVVYAFGTNNPSNFGHSPSEIDWSSGLSMTRGASNDVWIQGGTGDAVANGRNLALRGDIKGSNDLLVINSDGDYRDGTRIDGNVRITGDLTVDGVSMVVYTKTNSGCKDRINCDVNCNAGDVVVGGGFEEGIIRDSIPNGENGWRCFIQGAGGICYARCLDTS